MEISETFLQVFCFAQWRINENGGKQMNYFKHPTQLKSVFQQKEKEL